MDTVTARRATASEVVIRAGGLEKSPALQSAAGPAEGAGVSPPVAGPHFLGGTRSRSRRYGAAKLSASSAATARERRRCRWLREHSRLGGALPGRGIARTRRRIQSRIHRPRKRLPQRLGPGTDHAAIDKRYPAIETFAKSATSSISRCGNLLQRMDARVAFAVAVHVDAESWWSTKSSPWAISASNSDACAFSIAFARVARCCSCRTTRAQSWPCATAPYGSTTASPAQSDPAETCAASIALSWRKQRFPAGSSRMAVPSPRQLRSPKSWRRL